MFRLNKSLSRRFYSTITSTTQSSSTPSTSTASSFFNQRSLQHFEHTVDHSHVTTLGNGIQVVSRDHLGGLSKVSVRVNVGTRDEEFETSGISHFVQRFFFAPTVNRTFVNLASVFQRIGADVSAQHGREEIVYTSSHLRDATPTSLEVMSDSILYGRLHEWDMGSKRRLVEDDIEQFAQYPDLVLDQLLHATAFGHRQLGSSVSCPAHNLSKITVSQIKDFMNDNFTGENIRVVASNIEHDALVKMVENLFNEVPISSERSASRNRVSSTYVGGNAKTFDTNFVEGEPNARTAIAWRGFSRTSSNYYAALVLKHILGSSSRRSAGGRTTSGGEGLLAHTIMQSTDASMHSVETFNNGYSDDGLFGLKFTARNGKVITESLETTVGFMDSLSKSELPAFIIESGKRLAALELARASTSFDAEHEYMIQFPSGDEIQDAQRVFSVTGDDIRRVAHELLSSKPTVVSYGVVGDVCHVE